MHRTSTARTSKLAFRSFYVRVCISTQLPRRIEQYHDPASASTRSYRFYGRASGSVSLVLSCWVLGPAIAYNLASLTAEQIGRAVTKVHSFGMRFKGLTEAISCGKRRVVSLVFAVYVVWL